MINVIHVRFTNSILLRRLAVHDALPSDSIVPRHPHIHREDASHNPNNRKPRMFHSSVTLRDVARFFKRSTNVPRVACMRACIIHADHDSAGPPSSLGGASCLLKVGAIMDPPTPQIFGAHPHHQGCVDRCSSQRHELRFGWNSAQAPSPSTVARTANGSDKFYLDLMPGGTKE
jgi:hypothetical protein